MDGEIQYYALSALCYPLMYWAVHGTLVTPWVGAEEASLASTVRGLLLSTLLLVVSWNYAGWAQYEARRRQLNCGPIKRAPLRDPVLGIDFLLESLASLRKHHILDFYTETFKRYRATTYTTKVLGRTVLMTDEPENLKAILSKKFEDFPIGGIRLDAVVPVLGKASIFSSNGEDWHKARSFLRPSFVRNQVADLPIFDRHIQNMLARIPADGETFDMKNLLQAMTMDVSTDFMLGYSTNLLKTVSPEAQQFLDDFDSSSVECATRARLGPILLKLPHPKVDAAAKRMREYLGFYLRKAVADKTDLKDREYVFLNALLDSGASEGYIVDQILSVIVAGRDTTSAAMASCLWFLARDPAVWANLRREVKALGAENPSWEDLKNMKLLNQVVKESEYSIFFFSVEAESGGELLFPRLPAPLPQALRNKTERIVHPRDGG